MKRNSAKQLLLIASLILLTISSQAQYLWNNDSAFRAGVPNSGRLWGYIFGDYFHKSHSDSLNRGGNNQYTNVKKGTDQFQFRRIYIGFDYNINKTFSTEFLLAAEDDFTNGTTNGDVLGDNKFTPYIKFANIRWHDFLFKGNDLLFGLQPTPSFPYITENLFTYSRPVERTITDIRRTPSFDFGLGMQGRFNSADKSTIFGYDFLVANGTSAKPQVLSANVYKWFYGDAFVGFLNHRLIVDLYADYNRQNWAPFAHQHAARQMNKLAIVWVDKKFRIGAEGYINNLTQVEQGKRIVGGALDTLDGTAKGLSLYAHVDLIGTKLTVFGRYDFYNPNSKYDNATYSKYALVNNMNGAYEPNNKEGFLSAGFDYSPANNVHIMPNIWYNNYKGQQANLVGAAAKDYDLVYRVTFYFTFGKLFSNPTYSYYPYTH